jgi:hypothetical protein
VTPTAAETATAVQRGDLSAVTAVEAALHRITDRDPVIGAFQVVRTERTLAEASRIDADRDRATLQLAGRAHSGQGQRARRRRADAQRIGRDRPDSSCRRPRGGPQAACGGVPSSWV